MADPRHISFNPPKGGFEEASMAPCSCLQGKLVGERAGLLYGTNKGRRGTQGENGGKADSGPMRTGSSQRQRPVRVGCLCLQPEGRLKCRSSANQWLPSTSYFCRDFQCHPRQDLISFR